MTKRIIYTACGGGSGQIVKGLAMKRSIERRGLDVEFGMIISHGYEQLVKDQVDYLKITPDNCKNKEKYIMASALEWEPDVFLSAYSVQPMQIATQNYGIPAVLLWRKHMNVEGLRESLEPHLWSRIIGIEPECLDDFQTDLGELGMYSPPIYPTWEDELYSQEEARAKLLSRWDKWDDSRPVMVVAHNGLAASEMHELVLKAQTIKHRAYQILAFSQNGRSVGRIIKEPIARYFKGVDHLVAYAGQTIFWEWQRYKRPEATATWFEAPRGFDPQGWRKGLNVTPEMLFGGANGADVVIDEVLRHAI